MFSGIDDSTFTTFQHKFLVFVTGIVRAIELLMICSTQAVCKCYQHRGIHPICCESGVKGLSESGIAQMGTSSLNLGQAL